MDQFRPSGLEPTRPNSGNLLPQFMNHEGRIQEPFLSGCWVGPRDSDLAFRRVSA